MYKVLSDHRPAAADHFDMFAQRDPGITSALLQRLYPEALQKLEEALSVFSMYDSSGRPINTSLQNTELVRDICLDLCLLVNIDRAEVPRRGVKLGCGKTGFAMQRAVVWAEALQDYLKLRPDMQGISIPGTAEIHIVLNELTRRFAASLDLLGKTGAAVHGSGPHRVLIDVLALSESVRDSAHHESGGSLADLMHLGS